MPEESSSQSCLETDHHITSGGTDVDSRIEDKTEKDVTTPVSLSATSMPSPAEDGVGKQATEVADS